MEGKQPKLPSPFCLRLTPEERAQLEQAAGVLPLGAYVVGTLIEITSSKDYAFQTAELGSAA